ncbi:MAG TPA: hypothetical protein VF699_11445 [Caulobacteraceae bacterium]|jgi:hypothetical protein
MKRFAVIASALSLAALAACASETDGTAATAEAPQITQVAAVDTQALPVAIADEGPVDALQLPVSYNCAEGRTFTAVFPGHGRSVTVAAAGETRVLPHKGARDSVMFTDGGVTMTADGADATLTGLGEAAYTECMAG